MKNQDRAPTPNGVSAPQGHTGQEKAHEAGENHRAAIVAEIDAAILSLNPLTAHGEDAIWRPADGVRSLLIRIRDQAEKYP